MRAREKLMVCSRALVGANLHGKAKLQIDLTAIKSIANVKRDTMHVQGISYWAPANIGPYSQSVVASISTRVSIIASMKAYHSYCRHKVMPLLLVRLVWYQTHWIFQHQGRLHKRQLYRYVTWRTLSLCWTCLSRHILFFAIALSATRPICH